MVTPPGTGMFVEVELPVLKIKVRGRRFDISKSGPASSISKPATGASGFSKRRWRHMVMKP